MAYTATVSCSKKNLRARHRAAEDRGLSVSCEGRELTVSGDYQDVQDFLCLDVGLELAVAESVIDVKR